MVLPKAFATLMSWAPLMGWAALMGWTPPMGQALPRYDYLNPTDSWDRYC